MSALIFNDFPKLLLANTTYWLIALPLMDIGKLLWAKTTLAK